jgi:hypothetical protein
MKPVATGEMLILREEPPWWNPVARRAARERPLPDPQPGELYVQRLGGRDEFGNVRFALYWHELWSVIGRGGVSSGALKGQFFFGDDQPCLEQALRLYDRVIDWPSGDDITEAIRELL